mmetsp:Transcript_31380/g.73620  ORF Transcript_31380/g.73620 Transcript_31380/m.73620 type:complete len:220 (+) Transcript_31380:542-1201(+)
MVVVGWVLGDGVGVQDGLCNALGLIKTREDSVTQPASHKGVECFVGGDEQVVSSLVHDLVDLGEVVVGAVDNLQRSTVPDDNVGGYHLVGDVEGVSGEDKRISPCEAIAIRRLTQQLQRRHTVHTPTVGLVDQRGDVDDGGEVAEGEEEHKHAQRRKKEVTGPMDSRPHVDWRCVLESLPNMLELAREGVTSVFESAEPSSGGILCVKENPQATSIKDD